MDLVRELMEAFEQADIDKMKIEMEGVKLELEKSQQVQVTAPVTVSSESAPVVVQEVKEEKPVTVSTSTSLDIIKVTNQVEVQKVVDKLKNGEQVIVNMSGLSSNDLTRSLDFLTGAVYALNRSMQKVDEAIFIIS